MATADINIAYKGKTIQTLMEEVHENNVDKGWFEEDRSWWAEISLLHSEVAELFEAYRDFGMEDKLEFKNEHGYAFMSADDPNARRWEEAGTLGKPVGVGSEAADILIRLLDTMWRKPTLRSPHAMGRTINNLSIGQSNILTREYLDDISAHVAIMHQDISHLCRYRQATDALSVLTSLVFFCFRFEIDLMDQYEKKMAFNRTRPHKHGGKRL